MRRINKTFYLTNNLFTSMPLSTRALTATFFLVVSTSSFAQNSSDSELFTLLKRMSDADHNQNYQGTFILRKSDNLSTLQVKHGVDEKGDWESLQSLSGESRDVYKRNKQVVSVYPERKIVTIRDTDENHSLHPRLPANLDQLGLFYSMERLEDDRIANHQTVVVDLLPIDQYRYGYRYWMDKNTGMLLRCDLFDEEKTVIEQMMFTSLDYLSEPPAKSFDMDQYSHFQLQHIDNHAAEHESAEQTRDNVQWTVNRLPKGFMLTQSIVRNAQPQSQPLVEQQPSDQVAVQAVAIPQASIAAQSTTGNAVVPEVESPAQKPELIHMVYSDGLASVSVFVEKNRGVTGHLQGASSMGAVNAYGSPLGEFYVTVVGEVPANTVRAMAQSTAPIR